MSSIHSIYGFTGTVWEVPNIDTLTVQELLKNYTHVYYTLLNESKYYLGTKETINKDYAQTIARSVIITTPLTTELIGPAQLELSEWRIVNDAKESNGTIRFPSKEMLVSNGRRFFSTEPDGDYRYVIELSDNMSVENDPIIGTTDAFYDCTILDPTLSNITNNYHRSVLLIGGILLDVKKLYDYLGTGVNLKRGIGGWLPTLYKKVAEYIPPHECGLTWPIRLSDIQSADLYTRLLAHRDTRLIVFNVKSPISYEKFRIPRLYPNKIQGILCYDDRPSPNRVTDLYKVNHSPTKNALYPELADLSDGDCGILTIRHVVKDICPEEHTINFVTYEVKK